MVLLSVDALSTEILLKIFKNLDIYDLCKLKQTCRRFNEIINSWAQFLVKNDKVLVTNQVDPVIKNRSARILSPFERFRISANWRNGLYNAKTILHKKIKYIPWLYLEKDLLWLSRGRELGAYKRNSKGINTKKRFHEFNMKSEICKFVLSDSTILTAHTDGSMWLWCRDSQTLILNLDNCHESDINSVDLAGDLIVSGSRDNFVKIWRTHDDYEINDYNSMIQHSICLYDRVWSVSLAGDKSLLAIGTAGTSSTTTLSLFDLNSYTTTNALGTQTFGAGILDIKWENRNLLWTCGYDGYLRHWDLRTGHCEQFLEDPCHSTVYCMEYDHFNTIISGTESNGRVLLWDTRQKNYVQMYFMDCCRRREKSSPVYSLSFDPQLLFTVTDQHLTVLDFSIANGEFRDYSKLFLNLIKV